MGLEGKNSIFKVGGWKEEQTIFQASLTNSAVIFSPLFHLMLNMFVSGKQPTLDGISHHSKHQCLQP